MPDREGPPPAPTIAVPGLTRSPTDDGALWPTGDWWAGWNDPALAEVIEQGVAGSPDVEVAEARYRKAEGIAQRVAGGDWPSFAVAGDMARTRQSDNGMLPTTFFDNPYTDNRLLATLSWDLSFWGEAHNEANALEDEASAARIEAEGVKKALAIAIAQAYYGAGSARQDATIADEAVAAAQKRYDLLALRWQKGLASRLAERQAFGELAKTKTDRDEAQRRATVARNLLASLCGVGPDKGGSLDRAPDLAQVPVPPIPADLPMGLLARRADLAAARMRVEGALGHERAAEARFYPSINLAAFVGFQSLTLDTLFDADSLTWSAGPALRIPLFMGGSLRGGLKAARAGYDEAVARYHQRVIESARQVADRLADIDATARREATQREAVNAATEAHRLALLRYERGIDDYRASLETKEALLTQKRIAVRLQRERIDASLGLIGALGGGYGPLGQKRDDPAGKGYDHDQR